MRSLRTRIVLLTVCSIVIAVSIVSLVSVLFIRTNENLESDQLLLLLGETGERNLDYYFDSGILESNEEEVDIDLEAVAEHVCKRAKDEGFCSSFNPEEVFFIVQADLDFQEQNL